MAQDPERADAQKAPDSAAEDQAAGDLSECVIFVAGNCYVCRIKTEQIPGIDAFLKKAINARVIHLVTLGTFPDIVRLLSTQIDGWFFRKPNKSLSDIALEKQIRLIDRSEREMGRGEEWKNG